MKTHLSGIIPLANYKTDIEVSYPEFLLPVENGFNLIQKSVFECAMAGCDTIWIVANEDLAPITRKIIGDWVYDPVYYKRDLASKFYTELRKEVPIYYVGIHPKDRDRRDSYGWSILQGIYTAYKTSYSMSKWLIPEKYFISFPFAIYDPYQLREYRKQIRDKNSNFFLKYKNNIVKNNTQLPFTMTGEDFKLCRRAVNQKTTREYLPPSPDQQYPSQKLPLQERWSARTFKLNEIFEAVSEKNANYRELEWSYDASSWDSYCDYMSSKYSIKKPIEALTKPRKHVKIPYTLGD